MNIKIISVGKLKEQYLKDALKEYEKRLNSFCKLSVIEVAPELITDEALYDKYKDLEADRILQSVKTGAYVITLEIKGKKLSSEGFAQKIKEITNNGISDIIFIIGGANGLSERVSNIADFKLSFSDMTFTHQMIRILLTEQIYRAFKINANEQYHR